MPFYPLFARYQIFDFPVPPNMLNLPNYPQQHCQCRRWTKEKSHSFDYILQNDEGKMQCADILPIGQYETMLLPFSRLLWGVQYGSITIGNVIIVC